MVHVRGTVGVPNLELSPQELISAHMLNLGVCVVRVPIHLSFEVSNTGNMDVPFEREFYRFRTTAAPDELTVSNMDEQERVPTATCKRFLLLKNPLTSEAATPRLLSTRFPPFEPQDPSWLEFIDAELVMCSPPPHLCVTPDTGVFAKQHRTEFSVSYTPPLPDEHIELLLLLRNVASVIAFPILAISDEPTIALDIPHRIIDFGLCRLSTSFTMTFM